MNYCVQKREFPLYRLIFALCAVFFFLADASAESPTNPFDRLVNLCTRIFDLRERSPILYRQIENEFVSLTELSWIMDMTWSDPLLFNTVIHIEVGLLGVNDAPARGDLLIIPKHDTLQEYGVM